MDASAELHGGGEPKTLEHELTSASGEGPGLRWEIRNRPSYASLDIELAGGELRSESGAMVAMTDGLETEAKAFGGVAALARGLLGRESVFLTRYSGTGTLKLAPNLVGDIAHFAMSGRELLSQAGAFLAATPGVDMSTKFAGLRGLFGGEGAFFLRYGGAGDLFLTAYGAILEVEVEGSYVVDTGHLVAWDAGLDFRVRGAGGLKSLFFSGEGLTVEFSGRGTVWIQSRTLDAFVRSLIPYLPE